MSLKKLIIISSIISISSIWAYGCCTFCTDCNESSPAEIKTIPCGEKDGKKLPDAVIVVPKRLIKTSGESFSLQGLEIPIKGKTIKIGSLIVESKKIQEVSNIAIIIDISQYERSVQLVGIACHHDTASNNIRTSVAEDSKKIVELGLLISREYKTSEEFTSALDKWITSNSTLAYNIILEENKKVTTKNLPKEKSELLNSQSTKLFLENYKKINKEKIK